MKTDITQTTIRLPAELKAILEEKAERLGVSFNALIILSLWDSVKHG